jgi:hypothetical protein
MAWSASTRESVADHELATSLETRCATQWLMVVRPRTAPAEVDDLTKKESMAEFEARMVADTM